MKFKNLVDELHKRSEFYDDDILQELEGHLIKDLEENIKQDDKRRSEMIEKIRDNKIDLSILKNTILTKYNSKIKLNDIS
ncbi:hypothetical protein [Aquimarina spongiae]|uniref:Uncharacterized protein n=1 Tax=Aquimarina spongiae TaxID=570521 RepID=A0A1M6JDR7_9FLAO|nr:hypothetical protein [Aquimarina spongiae]SHJ44861.1 hypothetical protein SAMN04488508_10911 [Aquimarina spongiae]